MGLVDRQGDRMTGDMAPYGAEAMPIRLYIAALGGEGGSVLASWIVALAAAEGWPVQSTSIPGVAQRTGATTYYVEMLPQRCKGAGAPVFALTPTPGFVDVVVATELLESGRVISQGFVSPDRTTLIASSHRTYTIGERSAMSDERTPSDRILRVIDRLAARAIVMDLAGLARSTGAVINSVVFGAIAGAGVLPLARDCFEAVLSESGVAVEVNLRGFAAGFDAVVGKAATQEDGRALDAPGESIPNLPAEVETVVRRGVERLTEYQSVAYAERYLKSVERVLAAERGMGGGTRGWPVTREAARYLALWMSYEDIIRVAALKTRRERWHQIHAANPQGDRDTLIVTEFLKPGVEEFASLMPPRIGRWMVETAQRSGKLDAYNIGLHLRTTSIPGFLAMRVLARLRPWRPHSYRFREEMAAVEAWLDLVVEATRIDPAFGAEVVECARIRKGYGSTQRRGAANFHAIMTRIVRPAVAERRSAAELVVEMRKIALSDPEGTAMVEAVNRLAASQSRLAAPALANEAGA